MQGQYQWRPNMTQLQHPIGSPFSAASTAAEVVNNIDLSGKTAIVNRRPFRHRPRNHAYSGRRRGASDRAGARSATCDSCPDGIPHVEVDQLDLTNPASIAAFGQRVVEGDWPGSTGPITLTSAPVICSDRSQTSWL